MTFFKFLSIDIFFNTLLSIIKIKKNAFDVTRAVFFSRMTAKTMLIRVIFFILQYISAFNADRWERLSTKKRHMVLGWERAEIIDFSSIKVLSEL